MVWLPNGENNSKISLFVLTQFTNVTDTDRHTYMHDGIGRAYASHRAAKTGLLRLIWHSFTNLQRSLIIFGTERPYSILKKNLNACCMHCWCYWRCWRVYGGNTQLPWRSHDVFQSTWNIRLSLSARLSRRPTHDDLYRYKPWPTCTFNVQ